MNLAQGASTDGGKTLINAGFTGHPSWLEIPGEIEKLTVPMSFALGELDMAVKGPQIEEIRDVVHRLGDAVGEVRVYQGAGHGFCVRADYVPGDQTRRAEEAEEQALSWFGRHFHT